MSDVQARIDRAAEELRAAAAGVDPAAIDGILAALVGARRIALHGVGREGLMMRALAMRLFHLGLDVHVVGEMTTPPVAAGDLLLVSAGPGYLSTVAALVEVASAAGAKTACVTAEPDGRVPAASGLVLTIPAQTMARDQGTAATALLPMGSVFEGAMFVVFEVLVLALRDRLGVTPAAMRANHTNLE